MADTNDEQVNSEATPVPASAPADAASLWGGVSSSPQTERVKPTLLASPVDLGPSDVTVPAATNPTAPKPPLPKGHRRKGPLTVALIAIVVLALGFGGGWLGAVAHHDGATTDITEQKVELKGEATVISNIAKNLGPSVVSVDVDVTSAGSESSLDSFFGDTGGDSGSQTEEDAGTGMILTKDGLIMTNRHVVPDGTTSVSVTLSDGTVYKDVKVVGRTSDTDSLDVAFLQIQDTNGKTLTPVKLGDSSKVNVGDQVIAIGNALGQFQNTVTSGIISGYGRSLQASDSDGSSSENLDDLFQTDAAINEGNSGGPLVNLDGEVIGMNTALASDSQSIGFAIPMNDLSGLVSSVEKTGKLERPYLGVIYVPITSDVKEEYNLSVDNGAYIPTSDQAQETTIIAGGPADTAGVQAGDIITKINGTAINQTTSITSLLDQHSVGDKVTLTIVRGSKTMTIDVTLGAAPTSS